MKVIAIAGSCIVKNKKILLLKQNKENKGGSDWGPPAGHSEDNESLVDTAIRETKEESNLDVLLNGIVGSGLFRASDKNNYLMVLYSCSVKNIEKIKVDGSENCEYAWVSVEDISNDKYKLRHSILKPLLMKAITKKAYPLDVFVDQKILI